jgi:hypothetical protein
MRSLTASRNASTSPESAQISRSMAPPPDTAPTGTQTWERGSNNSSPRIKISAGRPASRSRLLDPQPRSSAAAEPTQGGTWAARSGCAGRPRGGAPAISAFGVAPASSAAGAAPARGCGRRSDRSEGMRGDGARWEGSARVWG